jgi:hypothetical protein
VFNIKRIYSFFFNISNNRKMAAESLRRYAGVALLANSLSNNRNQLIFLQKNVVIENPV